jgi:hypothetical protein
MNRVDNRWASKGVPILPKSLRAIWDSEPLPKWIADELMLPPGSTAGALGLPIWALIGAEVLTNRQRSFFLNLVSSRRSEIRSVRVFTEPIPYWLELSKLPFSTRTRNCLTNEKLDRETERLSYLTFGDLLAIQLMGVVSILELTCVVEAALGASVGGSTAAEPTLAAELLDIISESWVDQIGSADPRFSDILPPLQQATMLEILDALTSRPDTDTAALAQLSEALPELRRRLEQIRALPLEEQLSEFLRALSRFKGERLQAMVDRLGWGGRVPITLQQAGMRLNVTRERARQLQEKATSRLSAMSFPAFMPALDDALNCLVKASPIAVDAASALLKRNGISGVEFRPECLIAAALACGRKPVIQLQTVNKKTIVVAAEIQSADVILRTAYRQAQSSGASNVDEVVSEMKANKIGVDSTIVRHVLNEFSQVQFFEKEWFCDRPGNPERDHLRNVTRKMLSVAAPIELGIIREGLRREHRYRGYRGMTTWSLLVPPRSVLRAYYQINPEFIVTDDDLVKAAQPLDYRVELATNEVILVDALRSSPACVLDKASFGAECIRRSMNVNTFNIYLTYSPVIQHLDMDVWSLRGVRVDPAAVEAVRQANRLRPREKRVLDYGWTPDGQLWLAARLPSSQLAANLAVGIPAPIQNYLSGRQFEATDEDRVVHGSIRVTNEGTSYGFGRFLRQRGGDEGDILIAEFDLAKDVVLLTLGDDELLEELSPTL